MTCLPARASRSTVARPTNPDPPITATVLIIDLPLLDRPIGRGAMIRFTGGTATFRRATKHSLIAN
jgi:hypothetical protein